MEEKVNSGVLDSSNNENLNPNSIVTDNQVDLKNVGGDEKAEEEEYAPRRGEEARAAGARRGVKRRSLTETGEMVRPLQVKSVHFDDFYADPEVSE